ncbi:MAG: ATP-binding cassette domain-containing protein, partial [Planctomycetota bacterium]
MAELIDSDQLAVRLEMRGICKRFGATVALEDVGVRVAGGQVLALVGENGAGKSTLM